MSLLQRRGHLYITIFQNKEYFKTERSVSLKSDTDKSKWDVRYCCSNADYIS
jgi:hypothetical protein